jgi:3-oxoacyl-[acyl-carrier protein] reductase
VKLEGKTAIVTGGGTGIGAATAKRLAEDGANVVINYHSSADAAEQVAEACRGNGVGAVVVKGDVSSDADCRAIAQAALDNWGGIDLLVNNAGTTMVVEHSNLDGLQAEDFQKMYGTNVVGPYQMSRAAIPAMQKAGAGRIVNTSSIAGIMGNGSSLAYSASKGALNALTLGLARAFAPEITVNAVCPGLVLSEWFRDFEEGQVDKIKGAYEAAVPLGRSCTPEDIADTIMYLLTTPAPVTGELVVIDAGVRLGLASPIARNGKISGDK